MALPVTEQAAQAALAFLLGAALGTVYDFFKAFRLRARSRAATALLDLSFCALMALALFAFGLGPGNGSLRLFMLLSAALGWGAYALSLSPYMLLAFGFLVKCVWKAASPAVMCLEKLKKLKKNSKNIFPKKRLGFTMWKSRRASAPHGVGNVEGRTEYEAQTDRTHHAPGRHGPLSVRAGKSRVNSRRDRKP